MRPKPFQSGPWVGMRYNWRADPAAEYAYCITNMMPQLRDGPSPLVAVPPPVSGSGGFTAGRVQWIGVGAAGLFITGGDPKTVGIFGGELYTSSRPTGSPGWTLAVTAAQIAAAGITLSTTAKVYAVAFGAVLVISDGINTPFTWDGTAGAGLTKLTNAPVFYGRPTVYYGKLFAIKNTDRATFVWSEENAPNTGYEAGGYNNAWTLTQTGGGILIALLGTNQGLYYGRLSSVGVIRGAVTPDFTAAGVHDEVARTGVGDTESLILADQNIWLCDAMGRPWVIPLGGAAIPVWRNVADAWSEFIGDYNQATLGPTAAEIVWLPSERLVLVHWPFNVIVCFDADTLTALCFWIPASGMVAQSGVAIRLGTARTLSATGSVFVFSDQVGIGYSGGGDGTYFAVDFWPPPVYQTDRYPAFTPGGGATVELPFVVSPAWGKGKLITYSWTDAVIEHYLPRDTFVAGNDTDFLVDATPTVTPASVSGRLPTNLALVGSQTVGFSSTSRTNPRTTWGLATEGRQIMAGARLTAAAQWPSPWGVESITVVGVPLAVAAEVT